MDIADRAQPREEAFQAAALAAVLNRPTETPRVVDGVRVCLGCEYPIDGDRLEANPGAARCADCQTEHEKQQRRGHAG